MDTITASIWSAISSSILRKSAWVFSLAASSRLYSTAALRSQLRLDVANRPERSVHRFSASAIFFSLTSQSATTLAIFGMVSTNHRPRPPTPISATLSFSLAL